MRTDKLFKKISLKIVFAFAILLMVIVSILFVAIQAANAGNKLRDASIFGIGDITFRTDSQIGVIANREYSNITNYEASNTSLATYTTRNISTALNSISYRIEVAAQAAAEAAKADELVKSNIGKNNRNEHARMFGMPQGLSEVNWDITRDAFINEWSSRINTYLAGTPMANTGEDFANAAWQNGCDPRWSAAISNTESSKGCYCFASHNAWGWGSSSWSSWSDAIWSHVSGLSSKYGYTIASSYAHKYCPPNAEHWYSATLSEMQTI